MVEAYQIGVSFVADTRRVQTPIDEMLRSMARIMSVQRDVNMGFAEMVSGLGGARRLTAGMATDMERAARAARDIAKSAAQFRASAGGAGGSSGGGSRRQSRGRTYGDDAPAEDPAPYTPPMLMLPPPDRRLTYDPSAANRTSTAGMPGNSILGGPGVMVGESYGPPPPGRPGPLLLAAPAPRENTIPFGPSVPPLHYMTMTAQQAGRYMAPAAGMVGNVARLAGPYAAFAGIYGGAHGIHAMFRQGEEAGDTASLMAHAYGPTGRLWSDEQIRRAQDLALNAVRSVPGASYTGTLDMIARTSGITANADEALALAPGLARAGQIFAMRGGGPNALQQIEAAIQASEISGLNGPNGQLDTRKVGAFVDRLSQTAFAMQGTFDLGKYLTGLRQYGTGASGSSMDFLTAKLPAIMRVMQESRAGTALSSLDQLMLSPPPNTRNKRYAEEQTRLGLRDAKGNVVDRDQLLADPAQWYYSTLVPAFASHGITSRSDVLAELNNIFSRSTVQRLGATLTADSGLYSREFARNIAQQQQGNAPLVDYLKNAPGAQFASFTEAWRAFEAVTSTAMMEPVVASIRLMTGALTDVTGYVRSHPDDVKQFGSDVHALVSIMTGAAKAVGAIYSFLPDPLRHAVVGGVAGAATGGAIGTIVPGAGTAAGAAVGAVVGATGAAFSDIKQEITDDYRHIHIYMDGKKIAQHLATRQADQLGTQARSSGASYDPISTPRLPGWGAAH